MKIEVFVLSRGREVSGLDFCQGSPSFLAFIFKSGESVGLDRLCWTESPFFGPFSLVNLCDSPWLGPWLPEGLVLLGGEGGFCDQVSLRNSVGRD